MDVCLSHLCSLLEQTSGDHPHDAESYWQLLQAVAGEGTLHGCCCLCGDCCLLAAFAARRPGGGFSQLEESPCSPFLPVTLAPQKGPGQRGFQNGLCSVLWRRSFRKPQSSPHGVPWAVSYPPDSPYTSSVMTPEGQDPLVLATAFPRVLCPPVVSGELCSENKLNQRNA